MATGTTSRYVTLNVLRTGDSLYQGFGAATRGGSGGTLFRVITLDDNGDDENPVPGSLRDAVSQGSRYIVFDVAGTIVLKTHLWVEADHLTIDGLSAPPPGITLTRYGIILHGNRGAHDVIVRDLRIRDLVRSPTVDTQFDGIQIGYGAFNIVADHISLHGADDGSIDIADDAHDVTVSWSILGPPKSGKNMLIKYHPYRISLLHNLFANSKSRNPQIGIDNEKTPATEITVDMRNNLLWKFGSGTLVAKGAWANVVNNYYSKSGGPIRVQTKGRAYVSGNVVHNSSADINRVGKESAPFPAAPVDTTDAATAACQVFHGVGVRPLDIIDQGLLKSIALPGCGTQGGGSIGSDHCSCFRFGPGWHNHPFCEHSRAARYRRRPVFPGRPGPGAGTDDATVCSGLEHRHCRRRAAHASCARQGCGREPRLQRRRSGHGPERPLRLSGSCGRFEGILDIEGDL